MSQSANILLSDHSSLDRDSSNQILNVTILSMLRLRSTSKPSKQFGQAYIKPKSDKFLTLLMGR